jgi:hypothetical protein
MSREFPVAVADAISTILLTGVVGVRFHRICAPKCSRPADLELALRHDVDKHSAVQEIHFSISATRSSIFVFIKFRS